MNINIIKKLGTIETVAETKDTTPDDMLDIIVPKDFAIDDIISLKVSTNVGSNLIIQSSTLLEILNIKI